MIAHLLISWLVLTVAMFITAAIVPGFRLRGFGGALLVAALFGVLNVALGWVLFVAIGIGTLGIGFALAFLTRLVVNALLLKLVDAMTDRITIDGFGWALVGAACISVFAAIGDWLVVM